MASIFSFSISNVLLSSIVKIINLESIFNSFFAFELSIFFGKLSMFSMDSFEKFSNPG